MCRAGVGLTRAISCPWRFVGVLGGLVRCVRAGLGIRALRLGVEFVRSSRGLPAHGPLLQSGGPSWASWCWARIGLAFCGLGSGGFEYARHAVLLFVAPSRSLAPTQRRACSVVSLLRPPPLRHCRPRRCGWCLLVGARRLVWWCWVWARPSAPRSLDGSGRHSARSSASALGRLARWQAQRDSGSSARWPLWGSGSSSVRVLVPALRVLPPPLLRTPRSSSSSWARCWIRLWCTRSWRGWGISVRQWRRGLALVSALMQGSGPRARVDWALGSSGSMRALLLTRWAWSARVLGSVSTSALGRWGRHPLHNQAGIKLGPPRWGSLRGMGVSFPWYLVRAVQGSDKARAPAGQPRPPSPHSAPSSGWRRVRAGRALVLSLVVLLASRALLGRRSAVRGRVLVRRCRLGPPVGRAGSVRAFRLRTCVLGPLWAMYAWPAPPAFAWWLAAHVGILVHRLEGRWVWHAVVFGAHIRQLGVMGLVLDLAALLASRRVRAAWPSA